MIIETLFARDADNQVKRASDSTVGCTFLLSALKVAIKHDVLLRVVHDAFPPHDPVRLNLLGISREFRDEE